MRYILILSTLLMNFWSSRRDIKISVPATGQDISKGVEIAIDEMNESMDSSFIQKNYEDEGYLSKAVINAESIVEDRSLAVIGHSESHISASTASIYEFNKILMINPSSTSSKGITDRSYKYIFRSMPSDKIISRSMVEYMKREGYSRIMVCYSDNSYGRSFANAIESSSTIDVVDRVSFSVGDEREFKYILQKWSLYSFDAVVYIGYLDEAINFVRVMSSLDIPIICGESVATDEFIDRLGSLAEGIVMPQLFYPESDRAKRFVDKFRERHGRDPNFISAIAYDSAKMIGQAIKEEGVDELVKYIRKIRYVGVAHNYSFDRDGDVVMSGVGIQTIDSGRFKYLGRY